MKREWIDVTLDSGSRRGAAEAVATYATHAGDGDAEALKHLRRMLGSSRSELLLDAEQARLLLAALEVDDRMSALAPACRPSWTSDRATAGPRRPRPAGFRTVGST